MGLSYSLESCKGRCHMAVTINFSTDYKCYHCGYDYYEEIHGHKRPPVGMSLEVCKNLEKLFGTAE